MSELEHPYDFGADEQIADVLGERPRWQAWDPAHALEKTVVTIWRMIDGELTLIEQVEYDPRKHPDYVRQVYEREIG